MIDLCSDSNIGGLNIIMKKITTFLFLLLTFLVSNPVLAQLTGWPTSGQSLNVKNGEIIYLDDARVGISAVTSSAPFNLTVHMSQSTSAFNVGDFCLLMVMEDPNIAGFHKSCNISAINGGLITVTPQNSAGWNIFNNCTKMQLLKVPVYDSITLNNGQIMCHPYDESTYTGGVVAFVCDTFYLKGGYVNASGLGIEPYTMNFGNPGTGGIGSSTYLGDNGGYSQTNTPPCYNPKPLNKPNVITLNGTSGDAGLNNGNSGTNYSYFPTIPNSTTNNKYPQKINMGTPGNLSNNSNSASGGAGGGHGGQGRELNNTFIDGNPGENGFDGNEPNPLNSKGGGIIIAKIKILLGDYNKIISNTARFISTGGYGTNGGNGGFGGNGGNGGVGQTGYCTGDTVYFSGANGGYGEPGEPGNGGDATNGGQSGSIWYLSDQALPVIAINNGTLINYAVPDSGLFNVDGGKGGKGGMPGLANIKNYGSTSDFDTTNCNPLTWCNPELTITKICNCDSVFKGFQNNRKFEYDLISPSEAQITSLTNENIKFDLNWGVLKLEASSTLHYLCPMANPQHFKDILELIGVARFSPYQTDTFAIIETVLDANNNLRFQVDSTNWPIAEYDFDKNTLTDLDDPARKRVVETDCNYSNIAFGGDDFMKVGLSGSDGNDYPYPGTKSLDPSNLDSSANVVFNSPAPSVQQELNNQNLELAFFNIYPNPTGSSEIMIICNEKISSIEIFDTQGKQVLFVQPNTEQLVLNIKRLSPATYSIICNTQTKTISKKFIKLN